jgi:hypothetical protein
MVLLDKDHCCLECQQNWFTLKLFGGASSVETFHVVVIEFKIHIVAFVMHASLKTNVELVKL